MEGLDLVALTAQIAMGLTLAAVAGLRAFLPPLALAVASRAGVLHLSPELDWLASTPALVVLGAAVAFELLGDKLPLFDHLLDAAGAVLRPSAGALVAAVPLFSHVLGSAGETGEGGWTWALAIVSAAAGGTVSAGVHLAKSHARLGSSLLSAGFLNPVVSVVEDLVGLAGVVAAILAPVVAFALAFATVLAVTGVARRRRRLRAAAAGSRRHPAERTKAAPVRPGA